jgi:hypothetical protein
MERMSGIPEHIESLAESLLADAVRDMKKKGSIVPRVFVVGAGRTALFIIEGSVVNSGRQKDALVDRVKACCKDIDAQATVFLSDSWTGDQTSEQRRKTQIVETMLGQSLGIEAMSKAGLCTKREALMVIIQTKSEKKIIRQHYRREGGQILIEERTTLNSDAGHEMEGRMVDWL